MTTLENSYCVPKNSQWIELIGYVPNRDTAIYAVYDLEMGILDADAGEVNYLTEIPVQQFIDLVDDKITPWRLDEARFTKYRGGYVFDTIAGEFIIDKDGYVYSDETNERANITTFTDLLTLIKFLTPPKK